MSIHKCSVCNTTFASTQKDDDTAVAAYRECFNEEPTDDCIVICNECLNRYEFCLLILQKMSQYGNDLIM